MDNRIRHRAFTQAESKDHVPCSNRLNLESEKLRLERDIRLVTSLGLPTPIANEKLAKVHTRLNSCILCRGDCNCDR